MKNRNKYTNLATGMAFWSLNNGSIIFTALSVYGLMMIRDFTIKDADSKFKMFSETLIGLALIRGIVGLLVMTVESNILPYVNIFINIAVFAVSVVVLKEGVNHLVIKLHEFDLVNLISKVNESYYIIIVADAVLIALLLLVIFTILFPFQFLLNFISIFLNPTFNSMFGLSLTFIKYFASRSFSRASVMLTNATQIEEEM